MNRYICIGILGHEFDDIESGVSNSIAVRQEDKSTLWMKTYFFGKIADACTTNLKKGAKVAVEGKLIMNKLNNLVLIAEKVTFL